METFYIAGRTKNIPAIKEMVAALESRGYSWSFNWAAAP